MKLVYNQDNFVYLTLESFPTVNFEQQKKLFCFPVAKQNQNEGESSNGF